MRFAVLFAWATIIVTAHLTFGMHHTPRRIPHLHNCSNKLRSRATSAQHSVQSGTSSLPQMPLSLRRQEASALAPSYPDIVEANVTQPLDHFDRTTNVTFSQHYWYSLRHYKPQSDKPTPIFVLDSGEVSGDTRLSYLDHGILDILANATNGIGVVLEHRYYGKSIPDRAALGSGDVWGADELRWLTTKQALEDNAQFVQKLTFSELSDDEMQRLRAPNAPFISYGGSYPGAKSAFVRLLYPDLIFGSLASSAVVAAVEEFPQYYYPVAAGAQQECTQALQAAIGYVDSIVAPEPARGNDQPNRDEQKTRALLDMFGLTGLKNVADFANLLTYPLGSFQSLNWDPSVTSNEFSEFCTALVGAPSGPIEGPAAAAATKRDESSNSTLDAPDVVKNLAAYVKRTYVDACKDDVETCFGTSDWSAYTNATELTDNNGIAWTFQFCTQYGYFITAPPAVTDEASPSTFSTTGPKLISSLLDLNYTSAVCKNGFLPGKVFTVPARPQTHEVNQYGNFSIAVDRLAFIDGQYDPWRPATVHSQEFAYGGNRLDTLNRPFKLISNCWHHCDENGNKTYEPPRVEHIHAQQIEFVQHWLTQWK